MTLRTYAWATAIGLFVVTKPCWAQAEKVFQKAAPSTVVVGVRGSGSEIIQGSGVVIGKSLVATNKHVVEKAGTDLVAVRQGQRAWFAQVVSLSARSDLALLLILSSPRNGFDLPPAVMRPDAVRVGERVFALGSPKGAEGSITEGLVSGVRETEDGRVIQTSAAISHGSSGGGLFDAQARLVGITTMAVVDAQNLNFAIPVDAVREMSAQGETEGALGDPWRLVLTEKTADTAVRDPESYLPTRTEWAALQLNANVLKDVHGAGVSCGDAEPLRVICRIIVANREVDGLTPAEMVQLVKFSIEGTATTLRKNPALRTLRVDVRVEQP